MATKIEWTNATWNPVTGCAKVSPGCKHCYAEGVAARFWKGRPFTDVQCHEDRLDAPLRWRKPRKVFVNSMSDLFHEDVPDAFIDRVFAVMALAHQHTFQVLTKRAERMLDYMARLNERMLPGRIRDAAYLQLRVMDDERVMSWDWPAWPLPNVWIGVSVENQHFADERIPLLLRTPASVRFISAEPLLDAVNLSQFLTAGDSDNPMRALNTHGQTGTGGGPARQAHQGEGHSRRKSTGREANGAGSGTADRQKLSWVIVGGESGPQARPCCLSWIRNIVHDCKEAGVPCFTKQLGAKPYETTDDDGADGECRWAIGAELRLRDRKGGDPSEWPEQLRVREFPVVAQRAGESA